MSTPVTLIFDVGKTNKKIILYDEQYNIVNEELQRFAETKDEDGFPCEDLNVLTNWIKDSINKLSTGKQFNITAINFSAYGASLVHIDNKAQTLTPLYNYLKPYPEKIKQQFYENYGDENLIAKQTASPLLGSLNSGLQLYRLKYEHPVTFNKIKYSLHLPQYLSFIITQQAVSDITSIGCHTMLWNFKIKTYHNWVFKEKIDKKLAPFYNSNKIFIAPYINKKITAGIGLHDSSAALIPYLKLVEEPFILISTGTWCISLNAFDKAALTDEELRKDCLCYLSYQGKPIKAARLFAGAEHEEQVKRIAHHFNKKINYYTTVLYDVSIVKNLQQKLINLNTEEKITLPLSTFSNRALFEFDSYEEAYHRLMLDIITQQVFSTKLVLNKIVQKIFVDGGFSKNDVYMNLLAASFPYLKVYAAKIAQASALGAALLLNENLGNAKLPSNLIDFKLYKANTIQ